MSIAISNFAIAQSIGLKTEKIVAEAILLAGILMPILIIGAGMLGSI